MLKPFLQATFIILLFLATLAGCSDPTPAQAPTTAAAPVVAPSRTPAAPEPSETPLPVPTETPGPGVATTPLPANTLEPEGTEAPLRATSEPETLPTPASTEPPAQTLSAAPTAAPTTFPTAEPAPTPTKEPATLPPGGVITPLNLGDSEAALSRVSKPEISCLKQAASPGRLHEILRDARVPVPEEEAWIVNCLADETLFGVFVAMLIGDPGPLSQETSACLRTGLEWVDLRELMTEDTRGREQDDRAGAVFLSGYFTAAACLNQEEWDATAAALGLNPGDQESIQCFLDAVGGPEKLAAAMEGTDDDGSMSLYSAMTGCGLDFEGTSEDTQAGPPPTPPAPPTPTPTALTGPPPATSTPTTTLVITIAPIPAGIPEYDRSDWRHWADEDGDCQDARQETLIAESVEPVTYETDRQCRVATGQWWAPHLGHFLENPSHIDVDHHVPLKNAHDSGGWAWTPEMKEEYANYLVEENHLIAISSRHNRSKGARGPEERAPPDNGLWCDYARDWAEIKERWNLTMTPVEAAIVMDMLGTCENPPEYEVETLDYLGAVTGEDKPTEEPGNPVYGSCEEAAEAGEQRMQGSQGGGRGFPEDTVPSARDGDGDGVVCEN